MRIEQINKHGSANGRKFEQRGMRIKLALKRSQRSPSWIANSGIPLVTVFNHLKKYIKEFNICVHLST